MRTPSPQLETAKLGVLLGVASGVVAVLASSHGSWPFVVLATVPLVVRAAWPSMPLWLLLAPTTLFVMVAESVENEPMSATWLIGCVALVVASTDRTRRIEWIPIAAVIGGPVWLRLAGAIDMSAAIVGIWVMGLLLSATIGTIVGQQRRLIATMRAAQSSLAAAAAADERHRIARDLHDMVGHSFSVVLLHLAGARHLMSTDPERAAAALRQAEDVGRESMNDLRRSLALLRSNDQPHRPVGDLSALASLVDGMRQAGLDVRYTATGDLDGVDAAVGVVVHSVAREALTNAAKHAAAGPVTCTISVDEHAVLRVTNPARPSTDTDGRASADRTGTTGQGLVGMTERVHAVGGSLQVHREAGEWTLLLDVPARGVQGVR